MKWLQSPKACAALVMIFFLAVLISFWAMTDAGRDAVDASRKSAASGECIIQNRVVQLQKSPDAAIEALGNECIRSGVEAQVGADFSFLIAYSALTLALFLFIRTLRGGGPGLLVLGVLLALTMAAGDFFENKWTLELIRLLRNGLSTMTSLKLLQYGGWIKWSALGLSAAVLAALWPSSRRLAWMPKILALASAVVVLAGLLLPGWETLAASLVVLGLFWIAALIHAIVVVVDREASFGSLPVQEQGPKP